MHTLIVNAGLPRPRQELGSRDKSGHSGIEAVDGSRAPYDALSPVSLFEAYVSSESERNSTLSPDVHAAALATIYQLRYLPSSGCIVDSTRQDLNENAQAYLAAGQTCLPRTAVEAKPVVKQLQVTPTLFCRLSHSRTLVHSKRRSVSYLCPCDRLWL